MITTLLIIAVAWFAVALIIALAMNLIGRAYWAREKRQRRLIARMRAKQGYKT